jgi:hypothetical protein
MKMGQWKMVSAASVAALLLGLSLAPSAVAKTVVFEAIDHGRLSQEIYYGTITRGTDGSGRDVSGQSIVAAFVADMSYSVGSPAGVVQAQSTNFVSSTASIRIGGREDASGYLGDRIAYLQQGSGYYYNNIEYGSPFDRAGCQICGNRGDYAYSPLDYHQTIFSLGASIFTQNGEFGGGYLPDPHDPFPGNFTDYVDYHVRPGDWATGAYSVENDFALASGDFTINRFVGGLAHYRYRVFSDNTYATDVVFDRAGAVPEPAGWMLLIGGFGLAGAALRRRRTLRTGCAGT